MKKAYIALAIAAAVLVPSTYLAAEWLAPDCEGTSGRACVDVIKDQESEQVAGAPTVPSRSAAAPNVELAQPVENERQTKARITDTRMFLAPHQIKQASAESPQLGRIESLLNVPSRMRYGDFIWDESGIKKGKIAIRIDLSQQIISVFRDGHEIGTAVIVYGHDDHPTPIGYHPIRGKKVYHHSRAYDAPMPFTMWLTDDGVAIHASEVAARRASHGCIGVPPEFARKLFDAARKGDAVVILPA